MAKLSRGSRAKISYSSLLTVFSVDVSRQPEQTLAWGAREFTSAQSNHLHAQHGVLAKRSGMAAPVRLTFVVWGSGSTRTMGFSRRNSNNLTWTASPEEPSCAYNLARVAHGLIVTACPRDGCSRGKRVECI